MSVVTSKMRSGVQHSPSGLPSKVQISPAKHVVSVASGSHARPSGTQAPLTHSVPCGQQVPLQQGRLQQLPSQWNDTWQQWSLTQSSSLWQQVSAPAGPQTFTSSQQRGPSLPGSELRKHSQHPPFPAGQQVAVGARSGSQQTSPIGQ
jgi:hypothetical protein